MTDGMRRATRDGRHSTAGATCKINATQSIVQGVRLQNRRAGGAKIQSEWNQCNARVIEQHSGHKHPSLLHPRPHNESHSPPRVHRNAASSVEPRIRADAVSEACACCVARDRRNQTGGEVDAANGLRLVGLRN